VEGGGRIPRREEGRVAVLAGEFPARALYLDDRAEDRPDVSLPLAEEDRVHEALAFAGAGILVERVGGSRVRSPEDHERRTGRSPIEGIRGDSSALVEGDEVQELEAVGIRNEDEVEIARGGSRIYAEFGAQAGGGENRAVAGRR